MYKKLKKIKNVGSISFGQKPLVLHKIDRFSQHGAMTFRITAFGIATLSIMALIIKGFLRHSIKWHLVKQHLVLCWVTLCILVLGMLSVIMLFVIISVIISRRQHSYDPAISPKVVWSTKVCRLNVFWPQDTEPLFCCFSKVINSK